MLKDNSFYEVEIETLPSSMEPYIKGISLPAQTLPVTSTTFTVERFTLDSKKINVDYNEWKSWTGRRFINGEEHHGEIFCHNTNIPYNGARVCRCSVCQSYVEPKFRMN